MATTINASLLSSIKTAPNIDTMVLMLRSNGVVNPTDINNYLIQAQAPTGPTTTDPQGNPSNAFSVANLMQVPQAFGGAQQMGNIIKPPKPISPVTQADINAQINQNYQGILEDRQLISTLGEGDGDDGVIAELNKDIENRTTTINQLSSSGNGSFLTNILSNPLVQGGGAAAAGFALSEFTQAEVNNPTVVGGIKMAGAGVVGTLLVHSFLTNPAVLNFVGHALMHLGLSPAFAQHFIAMLANPWFAIGVMAAIMVLSILSAMGLLPTKDAAPSTTAPTVTSFLGQIPDLLDSLQSAAFVALVGGLTVGGISYNVTPDSLFNHFQVETVALAAAIPGAAQGSANNGIIPNVLYSKGIGPNGSDVVYLVTPGPNGKSSIDMFAMDSNGYIIGPDGPDTSGLTFFQPTIVNGKVSVARNPAALNAIQQIPACLAIANNTSLGATAQKQALETCMRANHAVTFVPIPNPT